MLHQIASLQGDVTGRKARFDSRVLPALLIFSAATVMQTAGVANAASPTPASYGLYNTGIASSGATIAPQMVDSFYVVSYEGPAAVGDPGTPLTNSTMYVTDPTGLPFAPPDNSTSSYISPFPTYAAGQSNQGGTYDISTTFTLANPAGVTLYGRFESDDRINNIIINGVSTGITLTDPDYKAFSTYFNLSSYLKAGSNTIDFQVYNFETGSNTDPVALRAEFLSAVPEPSVCVGVGSLLGLGLLGRWLSRRRAVSAA